MKLYRKYVRIRSFKYDDCSNGKVVQDWRHEEELDINKIQYEYTYCIDEKFVEVK